MKNQYWSHHWPVAVVPVGYGKAHIVDMADIRVVNHEVVYTLCKLIKHLDEIKSFSDRLDGDKQQLCDAVSWALLHVGALAWWIGNFGDVCPAEDGTITPWRERWESLLDYYECEGLR